MAAGDTTITKLNIEISASAAKAKKGLNDIDAALGRVSGNSDKAKTGFTGVSTSLGALAAKAAVVFLALKKVAQVISQWINESNKYQENLNLFTVAMGQYAKEAKKYAETVSASLGLDPAMWMRNQGIFMTLLTGFGNVEGAAYKMSKNLTQLGYDLSSLFNISVADAMQKLQSGIAGELEPLRRLGYDLSQTRLQQIAYNNGIRMSVAEMNQAQKSQLRYIAIMSQVKVAQGDLARTLESPANQLRILQAAATQAARALGNIFIPALNAVLPYAIAFLNVIQTVANAIATLFGFQLTSVDYSGVDRATSSMDDLESATTSAGGAAKKLKNYMMGIDELNVISPAAGGGGGGGGGIGGFGNLALPDYKFMDAIKTRADQIAQSAKKWAPLILAAIAFVGWMRTLGKLLLPGGVLLKGTSALTAGVLGLAASFVSSVALMYTFTKQGRTLAGLLSSLAVGFGIVGVVLSAAIGPIGWLIAGIGTLVGVTVGYIAANKELGEEQYAATQMAKDMAKAMEDSQDVIDRSTTSMESLKAATENYYGVITQYGGVRTLVDEIFDLSDKTNKTGEEMAILQTKVDLLNSMGLPDLTLSIDTTTGAVVETRDAIEQVIQKLEEQARMAALQDVLTESYKAQYQAALDYYTVAKPAQELAATAADTAKAKLDDMNASIEDSVSGWREIEDIDPLAGVIANVSTWWQKIQPDYQAAQAAVTDTTKALDLATQATDASLTLFSDASGKITFATTELTKLSGEADDATGYVSALATELEKLGKKPMLPPIDIVVNYKAKGYKSLPSVVRPELAAAGGVFNEGQMFIARESGAGPEMVGQFGSSSAVMNNDQIVDAVARGVASAVSAVMGSQSSGDTRPIILEVDGKRLATAVRDAEQASGYQMSSSTVRR